jgi:hypothetical protein
LHGEVARSEYRERETSTQRTQEEGKCKNKIQNSKREDSANEGKKTEIKKDK